MFHEGAWWSEEIDVNYKVSWSPFANKGKAIGGDLRQGYTQNLPLKLEKALSATLLLKNSSWKVVSAISKCAAKISIFEWNAILSSRILRGWSLRRWKLQVSKKDWLKK